jgi:acyl-CoA thioester hydrolase
MADFVYRLEVRFRDCDPMGHVNNAVYFTYLEQSRFAHWRSLWPRGWEALSSPKDDPRQARAVPRHPVIPGVILAHAECDYKRPVKYGETIEVRLRVAKLGRTSFQYEYEIVDAEQRPVATARTVQVMYDYENARPMPIPDDIRHSLTSTPARQR